MGWEKDKNIVLKDFPMDQVFDLVTNDEALLPDALKVRFDGTVYRHAYPDGFFAIAPKKHAMVKDIKAMRNMKDALEDALKKSGVEFCEENPCTFEKIKDMKISLPSKEVVEPDWKLMHDIITELMVNHMEDLDDFFLKYSEILTKVADGKPVNLTEEDRNILSAYDINFLTKTYDK